MFMKCWHNERSIKWDYGSNILIQSWHLWFAKVEIESYICQGKIPDIRKGKDSRYKMFCVGNGMSKGGVGIWLAEKWVEAMFDVKCVSYRIMFIKLVVVKSIVTVLSVCMEAPKSWSLW